MNNFKKIPRQQKLDRQRYARNLSSRYIPNGNDIVRAYKYRPWEVHRSKLQLKLDLYDNC